MVEARLTVQIRQLQEKFKNDGRCLKRRGRHGGQPWKSERWVKVEIKNKRGEMT